MINHNLIAKYLEIISDQDKLNKELSTSNLRLVKRNNELNRQKNQYRESCKEWKAKYDGAISITNDFVTIIKSNPTIVSNIQKAIKAYKQNQ